MSKDKKPGTIYGVSSELVDEFDGYSAKKISKMPMSEYAKRTGRQISYLPEAETTDTPTQPVPVATTNDDSGLGLTLEDIQGMSNAEYGRLRRQLGIGQQRSEGIGILNQATSDISDGIRRNAGRGALSNKNVSLPPRIDINTRLTKDNEAPTGRQDGFRFGD